MQTPVLYKLVRHPLMLGFLIAFWATPHMTLGHLLFALGMTAYILIWLCYEERDLLQTFGTAYQAYRRHVPMLIPEHAHAARRRFAAPRSWLFWHVILA